MKNDSEKIKVDDLMVYMIIVGFLTAVPFGIAASYFETIPLLVLFIIASAVLIVGLIGLTIQGYIDKNKKIANINLFQQEFQQEYNAYVDKMGIVKSDTQATLVEQDEYGFHSSIPQYLWIDNGILKIFPLSQYYIQMRVSSVSKPDISELRLRALPIESILYFEEIGELRKYTKVTGGGTSLKGALLGYAIAEDVGAIIGSRQPVETEVITEDDRKIELIYKNQENEVENLEFEHDAYKVLKRLIPSKELRRIVALGAVNGQNGDLDTDAHKSQTVKEKLNQLNDLKDEGFISESEFLEQKKRILDTI